MSKHHTVPKFYVSNFCNEDGQIFFFDRKSGQRNKRVQARNPESVFWVRHHNSFLLESGEHDESLEKGFAQHDSAACDLIRQIIETLDSESIPVFDDFTREQWDTYALFLMKRQPEFLDRMPPTNMQELLANAVNKYEHRHGRPPPQEELASITEDVLERDRLRMLQRVRGRIPEKPLRALGTKNLKFVRIKDKAKSFCIGSQFFCYFGGTGDIRDENTALFVPLSRKYGFAYVSQKETRPIMEFDQTDVRRINMRIAQRSRMFGSASRKLTESLVKAVGE